MTDVVDYCRQVEAHLTRTNGGHLVRVVGPGFALVKRWADEGVPLSVVFRGIQQKAERHAQGASKRPLRIEFCEADVRALFEDWRRAIGVTSALTEEPLRPLSHDESTAADPPATSRRRSVPKAIDRAIERLGRLAGRLELPEEFRDAMSRLIEQLSTLREDLSHARGDARQRLLEKLPPLDHELIGYARGIVSSEEMKTFTGRAEGDLAPFRDRLAPEAWDRAVAVTVDRLVREHVDLPSLDL